MASRYCFLNNHVHVIKGSQTRICKPRIPKIIVGKRSNNTTPNTNPIRRRFITISPGDSKWHGNWDSEYKMSLHDLRLEDLVDDDHKKNAQVSVTLTVEKHASFGLSVDGRIITSFPRKCSTCSSTYCRKIDTEFNVWILPSRRVRCEDSLPEIGGEDPSVIYVKPGSEADLDSLVQDTIRITASIKDTCSEVCEKSPFTIHNNNGQQTGSIDKRWSRLLELKKSHYS